MRGKMEWSVLRDNARRCNAILQVGEMKPVGRAVAPWCAIVAFITVTAGREGDRYA